jgi:DeoR family fructose operon transcriptional repressor
MLRSERQAKILQAIRDNGSMESDSLMDMFGVSHVTIRRDLVELANQNLIRLDHGGATNITLLGGISEPSYDTKIHYDADKKNAMVREAINVINDDDFLILDAGTTTYLLAKQLAKEKFKSLTVITCDLMVAKELSPHPAYTVIMLGGILRKPFYNVYGPFLEAELDKLRGNKLFLSFDGASITRGISLTILEEIPVKHKMIEICDEVIAFGDSSKYGVEGLYNVCGWEKINRVIVDDAIDKTFIDFFDTRHISYHIGSRL